MKFKSNIEVQAGIEDKDGQVGSNGQILASTGSQVDWIDPANIVTSATDVIIECKNTSGVTIAKGTPVYQTGNVGATAVIEVAVADASDEDKMAAIGLLQSDLINNAFGYVVVTGELLNITTSPIDGVTPTTGDTIYVKPGGGLTLTKPTGVNFIQNVGLVGKVSGGNAGSLTVSSIMRSNDVPTPLYIDHDNQILGIGTTSPSVYHKLDVNGSANFSTDIVVGRNATALSFDMNPAYDSGNYYLNLHKNQSNDGGVLLYSKPTSGSAQLDWQIVNQGTTGDLKFYAAGLAGNALVLDRETGNLQLPEYGAGTLVSDASGNITVSSGGGAGGPYLPLSAGASYPLTGDLAMNNNIGIITKDSSGAFRDILKLNSSNVLEIGSSALDTNTIFKNSGNVGIGTDEPSQKLTIRDDSAAVYSTGDAGTNTGDFVLQNNNETNDNFNRISFQSNSDNNQTGDLLDAARITAIYPDHVGGNPSGELAFETKADAGGMAEAMRIDRDGKVGIGTSSPSTTLHVNGFTRINGGLQMNTANATIYQILDSALRFGTNNTERMRIDSSGNVGIGTTSPSEKLDVNGNIKVDNALLSNQENTDIDSAAAEVVAQVAISYTAAFFDFVVKKGTNVRSGTVYACHDGTNVEFTETSTNDLGDTSDVTLSVDKTSADLRLIATVTSDDWSVKSLIRAI